MGHAQRQNPLSHGLSLSGGDNHASIGHGDTDEGADFGKGIVADAVVKGTGIDVVGVLDTGNADGVGSDAMDGLQQDLADRQNFVVSQMLRQGIGQTIPFLLSIINNVLHQHLFGKEASQGFDISLNGAGGNVEHMLQFAFFQNFSAHEFGVYGKYACGLYIR